MNPNLYQTDNVDLNILQLLSQDAQMPFTEIAKKVFVSPGTVHVRVKKLASLGILKGSTLRIDYQKLGFTLMAFIGIYLERNSYYDTVKQNLLGIPEIISCHYITGNYSIFAQVVCKDTTHLKGILHDKIQPLEGVARTETFISLEQSIDRGLDLAALKGE